MIDLHCHVLPGVDDGPATLDGAVALVARAAALGVRTLVATPHVSERYPNNAATIAAALSRLRAAVAELELEIDIESGAEIELTMLGTLSPAELAGFALGNGRHLLMECPLSPAAGEFAPTLMRLLDDAQPIVLAHPERCPEFQRHPDRLAELVYAGALTSVTAGAIAGGFGDTVRSFTLDLLADGLVHNVSSDCHDLRKRPPGMRAEIETAESKLNGLTSQADWLTGAVPAAIIAGEPVPPGPPPPTRPHRGALSWLRR
jgi:protein-tyrosine phosphatase